MSQALFRRQGDELVVQMPDGGIEPSWLASPLEDLGLGAGSGVRTMRVETPVEWRWGTVDAAFLARVVQQLDRPPQQITIYGLPQNLQNLLALARAKPSAGAGTPAPPGFTERVGLRAVDRAHDLRASVNLLGEVVLLLPRFFTGRAKIRGSEMLEVLAESSRCPAIWKLSQENSNRSISSAQWKVSKGRMDR